MKGEQRGRSRIDESLLAEVASLPAGGQRWLKAALQAVVTLEPFAEQEEAPPPPRKPPTRRRADLEDLLSGDADLREQAQQHPELAEELKGIADIVDLLREAGRRRRRLGEEILRQQEEQGESEAEDEEEAEG